MEKEDPGVEEEFVILFSLLYFYVVFAKPNGENHVTLQVTF